MVLSALLLQKPFHHSTAKDHVNCLEQRLVKWHAGHVDELLHESRTIQRQSNGSHMEEQLSRKFGKLMRVGNVRAAIRLLSNSAKGGVLSLDSIPLGSSENVRDILIKKHPIGQPVHSHTLLSPEDQSPLPQFDQLNALRTRGAAGPSGFDDGGMRRLCTSFKDASQSLCSSLARTAKRICTSLFDPAGLAPLLSSRLIALDKCPGVRPIGI